MVRGHVTQRRATLSSRLRRWVAGVTATLTAVTDQDVAATSSTFAIIDETTDVWLATCTTGTTCNATTSFDTGGPHTYVATVNALRSNEVTVAREAWTVSLASSETSFSAGDAVTFTATANQSVAATGGYYLIFIFDETTGDQVSSCSSGTTCTYTLGSPFSTGGAHDYVAEVSQGSWRTSYATASDVQATSNVVAESRAPWTVMLTASETAVSAGDSVTLTATGNQDLSNTGLNYKLRIFDQTTGAWLTSCGSGTTCTYTSSSLFYAGSAHTYIAEVAGGYYNVDLSSTVDVQAISDPLTLSQTPWSLTLTSPATTFAAGASATVTATANQSLATVGGYQIYIYDETTGTLQNACSPSQSTCTANVSFYSGGPHTYKAVIGAYGTWDGTSAAGVIANPNWAVLHGR